MIAPAPDTVHPNREFLVFGRGTSKGFRLAMANASSTFDPRIREHLRSNGYQLMAVRALVEAEPELRGKSAGQHNNVPSFEYIAGVALRPLKRAMVAERYTNFATGLPAFTDNVGGAVRHEVGHILDYSLGRISQHPLFVRAHQHDARALKTGAREGQSARGLDYYLADDERGRSEAFAENWAQGNGGGSISTDFSQATPTVYRLTGMISRNVAMGREPMNGITARSLGFESAVSRTARRLLTLREPTAPDRPAAQPPAAERAPKHQQPEPHKGEHGGGGGSDNARKLAEWKRRHGRPVRETAFAEPATNPRLDRRV